MTLSTFNKQLPVALLGFIWRIFPSLLALALIILAVVLAGQVANEKQRLEEEKRAAVGADRPPVNVVVLRLSPQPVEDRLILPGVVEPWANLTVVAEVGGKVVSRPVSEGDRVEADTLLVQLEPADYRHQLADLESQATRSQKELSRLRELAANRSVAESRLDDAIAAAEQLGHQVENARLRLQRTAITAGRPGIVEELLVEEEGFLAAYDPVARVVDIDRVKVGVGIPESDVEAVRHLGEFAVEFDALGGRIVTGRKDYLATVPASRAHLYQLVIALDNPGHRILPGMFARVRLVKRRVEEALMVPLYAVLTRQDQRYLMVEREGVVLMRPVETGIMDGWNIQITAGVEPGERVVVVGQRSVSAGQAVKVIRVISAIEELYK